MHAGYGENMLLDEHTIYTLSMTRKKLEDQLVRELHVTHRKSGGDHWFTELLDILKSVFSHAGCLSCLGMVLSVEACPRLQELKHWYTLCAGAIAKAA